MVPSPPRIDRQLGARADLLVAGHQSSRWRRPRPRCLLPAAPRHRACSERRRAQQGLGDLPALVLADQGDGVECIGCGSVHAGLNHICASPKLRNHRNGLAGGRRIDGLAATINRHARLPRPNPAEDPDRTLHRRRPAGGLAHAVEVLGPGAVAGDDPQRDVRPGGDGLHRQPAHLGRTRADAAGLPLFVDSLLTVQAAAERELSEIKERSSPTSRSA
jgi:hypothetical protein